MTMTTISSPAPSVLVQYLPAIYQEDPFIGGFLPAFEKILLGRTDAPGPSAPGLEETIAKLAVFFDPKETPEEFLSWLADWTAFSYRSDLDPLKQRDFISKIIQFYRRRGTKENLKALLEIFTTGIPTITENQENLFQIEKHSTIGKDTYLGGGAPHYFQVTISLPQASPAIQNKQMAIAYAIINLEKPAHAYYSLGAIFPSMEIGCSSTIGVDTQLGMATDIDLTRCRERR